jgi:DNA-binding NarL/FixJ family response regulator
LIRAGLEAAVRSASGFELRGSVADEGEMGELGEDVQILVVDLPEPGTLEPWQRVRASGMPLVLLCHSAPLEWLDSLRLGGIALLSRHAEAREIRAALLAVSAGLTVLTGPLTAELVQSAASPPNLPLPGEAERLTVRELEVLELLAQGLSNKGVALRLAVSEHTAKFHVGQILGKLGANTRTEAVAVALRRGLVGL